MSTNESGRTARASIVRWSLCGVALCFCFSDSAAMRNLMPAVSAEEIVSHRTATVLPSEEYLTIYGAPRRSYHPKGDAMVRQSGKACTECHIERYYPGKDFFGWEHGKKWKLHWVLFSLASVVMLTGVYAAASIWRLGEKPSLHHPVHWSSVASALFWEVFLGRRIWKQSRLRWCIFFFISMSFVELFIVFIAMVVTRYLFPTPLFISGPGGWVLDFLADFLGLLMLVGIVLALHRRYRSKEPHLESQAEDVLVLWLLFGIVVTGFFLEACRLAVVSWTPQAYASFVGAFGASLIGSIDLGWTGVRFYVWIVHAVLVCAFVAYLPFSKLFHVITCPVSILSTSSEAAYRQRQ